VPKKTSAEPCDNWVPLKLGVFTFHGLAPDGEQLTDWCKIMAMRSNCVERAIDQETMSFIFHLLPNHELSLTAAPWILLEEDWFHRGFKWTGTGEAKFSSTPHRDLPSIMDAVRDATDFVWNKRLLPAFAEAVTGGAVVVYARPHSLLAPFAQFPRDLWPVTRVVDWPNGTAFGPDGSVYYSLHVQRELPATSVVQRQNLSNLEAKYFDGRTRGPRPLKREKIKRAMQADIQAGRFSLADLKEMNEEALAATYDASRDTVRKALKDVMSEFATKPIIDK
jgi:hypothetical protein